MGCGGGAACVGTARTPEFRSQLLTVLRVSRGGGSGMRSHNNRRGPKETLMVVVVVVGP